MPAPLITGGAGFVADGDGGPRKRQRQLRYVAVGALNTLFGLGLFAALDLTLARYVGHYVVLTVASVISIAVSHTTQRRWVWRSTAPYFLEVARFFSVYAITYILNLAFLFIAHTGLRFPVIPAQVAITGLLVVGTYAVHRVWTFAPSQGVHSEAAIGSEDARDGERSP